MANDHYVPQLYLRQFGISERQINVATISPYRFITGAPIRSQCQKAGFYENHKSLDELILKGAGGAATLLRNVTKNRDFTEAEAMELTAFVAESYARTRKTAEFAKILPRRLACDALRGAIARGELPPNPSGEVLEDVIDFKGVPPSMLRHSWVGMLEMLTMECKLLVADPGSFFVTSDHPVALLNQFYAQFRERSNPIGFSKAGLQIVMPISPELCLFIYDLDVYKVGAPSERTISISARDTDLINSLQVHSADNCLYLHDANREPYVKSLIENYGDLRVPMADCLQELKLPDGAFLHVRNPPAIIRTYINFCRVRKNVQAKPGDLRSEIWTSFIGRILDDFDRNPSSEDFETRYFRVLNSQYPNHPPVLPFAKIKAGFSHLKM